MSFEVVEQSGYNRAGEYYHDDLQSINPVIRSFAQCISLYVDEEERYMTEVVPRLQKLHGYRNYSRHNYLEIRLLLRALKFLDMDLNNRIDAKVREVIWAIEGYSQNPTEFMESRVENALRRVDFAAANELHSHPVCDVAYYILRPAPDLRATNLSSAVSAVAHVVHAAYGVGGLLFALDALINELLGYTGQLF